MVYGHGRTGPGPDPDHPGSTPDGLASINLRSRLLVYVL